jgi:putative transposase
MTDILPGGRWPPQVGCPGDGWKLMAEYARRYNGHRPHQGLQQEPPQRQSSKTTDITARIERRQVLDGLISEYRRVA